MISDQSDQGAAISDQESREELAPAMAAECEAEGRMDPETRTELNAAPEGESQGGPGEPAAPPMPPPMPRMMPRFPDLREQWDKAITKGEGEIAANLHRAERETTQEWVARNGGPIRAGHPHTRRATPGVPRSAKDELPFDPDSPPQWSAGSESWSEEEMAAWFRCRVPEATEMDIRDFGRTVWGRIHADRVAGHGGRCSVLQGKSEEEIARWYRALLPSATARDAENYAEIRVGTEIRAQGSGVRAQ